MNRKYKIAAIFVLLIVMLDADIKADPSECSNLDLNLPKIHCIDSICGERFYNMRPIVEACGNVEISVNKVLEHVKEEAFFKNSPKVLYFQPGYSYKIEKPLIIKAGDNSRFDAMQLIGGNFKKWLANEENNERTTFSCQINPDNIDAEYTDTNLNCSEEHAQSNLYAIKKPFVDIDFLTQDTKCRKIAPCISYISSRTLRGLEYGTVYGNTIENIEIKWEGNSVDTNNILPTGLLYIMNRAGVLGKNLRLTDFPQGIFLNGTLALTIRDSEFICGDDKECFVGLHIDNEDRHKYGDSGSIHAPGNSLWFNNLTFENYTNGIIYEYGNGSSIMNSTFKNIKERSIWLFGVTNISIDQCKFIRDRAITGTTDEILGDIQMNETRYIPTDIILSECEFNYNCNPFYKFPIFIKHPGSSRETPPRLLLRKNSFRGIHSSPVAKIKNREGSFGTVALQCYYDANKNIYGFCSGETGYLNEKCEPITVINNQQ